jgi:hypothetical protein
MCGGYVLLQVHRNTVFVIERRTAGDSLWHKVLDVRDYIATLTPGTTHKNQEET